MSAHQQIVHAASGTIRAAGLGPVVKAATDGWAWAMQCRARAAQRRHLAQLPDRQLRDLGISRVEAAADAAKWFWRS